MLPRGYINNGMPVFVFIPLYFYFFSIMEMDVSKQEDENPKNASYVAIYLDQELGPVISFASHFSMQMILFTGVWKCPGC